MVAYDALIVFEMWFHSLGWNLGKVCMGSWKLFHLMGVWLLMQSDLGFFFDSLIAGNSQTWFPAC